MRGVDDRGVPVESVTNQLRSIAKQKPRKRKQPILAPLAGSLRKNDNNSGQGEKSSLQRQIQGPLTLQWLVDDFVKAAGTGDVERVDHYIRGGIPIDRNHSVLQYNALHASTALGKENITKHLVQAGADVNLFTKDRESALHLAARYGSTAVAQEILRSKADMHGTNQKGMTPMQIAAELQDHNMERILEPLPDAPTAVHAQVISPTSLTIAWTSSNSCSSNSNIAGSAYVFKVTWVLCGTMSESSEECATTTLQIRNLLPASQYQVTVQAGNRIVGWSASSSAMTFQTKGDVPNAMAAPIITDVSHTTIRMQILLPHTNGSHIMQISMQTQCTGSISTVTTRSFRKLLRPHANTQAWKSVVWDVNALLNCTASNSSDHERSDSSILFEGSKEVVATGLSPGHVYYFRFSACNSYGWSPAGEASDGICTNDCPKVVQKTARSMTLVWTKPYATEHIDYYKIEARTNTDTQWKSVATNITGQKWVVTDLHPAIGYSFRVVPHFASNGWEEAEKCTFSPVINTDSTTPDKPKEFQVVDRTAHSISVTWEIPRCNGHVVLAYAIEYRCTSSIDDFAQMSNRTNTDWHEVDAHIPIDFRVYTVSGLKCGHGYQFRVKARNTMGDGPYAEMKEAIWTYRFLPPTAPVCVARTSFSLQIEWKDGRSAETGDDINKVGGNDNIPQTDEILYEVQMCKVESHPAISKSDESDCEQPSIDNMASNWTVCAQNLRSTRVNVSGLSPLGCYRFRVQAYSYSSSPLPQQQTTSSMGALNDNSSVFSTHSAVFQTLRRM